MHPFGARCFLSARQLKPPSTLVTVLMHPLALGAFCPDSSNGSWAYQTGLNAPFGARCFLTVIDFDLKGENGEKS